MTTKPLKEKKLNNRSRKHHTDDDLDTIINHNLIYQQPTKNKIDRLMIMVREKYFTKIHPVPRKKEWKVKKKSRCKDVFQMNE